MSDESSQNYFIPQSRADIITRYGDVIVMDGQLTWPNMSHWLKPCMLQPEITAALKCSISGKPVEHIFANIDMHKPMLDAFQLVIARGLTGELKTFDGCYNCRFVRGRDGIMSIHSWGIALDLNAAENPLEAVPKWSPDFVDCWTSIGFSWGGNFKRLDGMHFQLCSSF